ncbi:MAG: hypothetical protein HYS74_02085 [Parcubacteria group bacterium]|nr:hypothetical protein [Parcubacteria group bacterium]
MERVIKNRKGSRVQCGYMLLLAIVVASIILTIGVGMMTLVEKGLVLSSSGRESQFSFYAADSGGECALYWDIRHTGFGATVFATSTASTPPSSGVICNGQDIAQSWTRFELTADSAKTTFDVTLSNGTCATVLVHKQSSGTITTIESHGYNTCNLNYPRRVERAIRITY